MNILKLTIKNAFAHKDTEVSFENGINWILGENEGGKSELLDMIQYAITGKGLKTAVSDYKGLEVVLYFKIKDSLYRVQRGKSTKLDEVDKDLKVINQVTKATTATNNAIAERLGYDASVFASLNYSKQLNSTDLTSAGTMARLSLINKVNGVEEATAFEKHLDSVKKDLKSQLKALQGNSLVDIVDFTFDEELDTLDLESVNKTVKTIYDKVRQLESLKSDYNSIYVPSISFEGIPEEYVSIPLPYLKDKLHIASLANTGIVNSHASIKKVTSDISKISIPSNNLNASDLALYEDVENHMKSYSVQQSLIDKHSVTCPECSHTFLPNLKAEDVLEAKDLPFSREDYLISKTYLNTGKQKLEFLEDQLSVLNTNLEDYKNSLSTSGIDLKALDTLQDFYHRMSRFLNDSKIYESKINNLLEKYDSFSSVESIESSLESLEELQGDLSTISEKKEKLVRYDAQKRLYESSKKTQAKIDSQINILEDKIFIVDSILSKSKELKLDIQNNCIPVLNTIASKMINKMTGGKRFGLTLTDTFDLLLDGKPIESYSGSTIVLANVAFKVSLIEMFYKKTFPVFIGDEIDAFADSTRAQHIHDAFNTLSSEGYQLLLVSHNSLDFKGNKIYLKDVKKC